MKDSAKVTNYGETFIELLDLNHDQDLLPEIAAHLTRVSLATHSTVVKSAVPLTSEQKERIAKSLKDENIKWQVDEDIIGGLVVEQGGERLDLSLKNRL